MPPKKAPVKIEGAIEVKCVKYVSKAERAKTDTTEGETK